jgi:hypothetical protein
MANSSRRPKQQIVGLVGVGLDNADGQKRLTRNEDILLVGGSAETHASLQEVSIRLNEQLRERGKRLGDAEPGEVLDLLHEAVERSGNGPAPPGP